MFIYNLIHQLLHIQCILLFCLICCVCPFLAQKKLFLKMQCNYIIIYIHQVGVIPEADKRVDEREVRPTI